MSLKGYFAKAHFSCLLCSRVKPYVTHINVHSSVRDQQNPALECQCDAVFTLNVHHIDMRLYVLYLMVILPLTVLSSHEDRMVMPELSHFSPTKHTKPAYTFHRSNLAHNVCKGHLQCTTSTELG